MNCRKAGSGGRRLGMESFGTIQTRWLIEVTRNDASAEPMNPLWTTIHRLLWCTMIGVISGHRSWSGTSRKNATLCGYIPPNFCTRLRRKKKTRRKIHFFFISVRQWPFLKNVFRRYFRLRTAVLRMYRSCKLWRMRSRSVHFQRWKVLLLWRSLSLP